MSYRIVGFEWRAAGDLRPHPQALMPIDDEDRAAINGSVSENGVLIPILITAAGEILDGVNRWVAVTKAASTERAGTARRGEVQTARLQPEAEGEMARVPCLIVEADDPAQVARECLASGRKRTTGQRIMAYLEGHKREVLAAWRVNAGKGEIFRKHSKASLDALDGEKGGQWTADAISKRLKCSDRDVEAAIELLNCIDARSRLQVLGRVTAGSATAEYMASLEQQRLRVLSGSVGIRRWKSAVGGRESTEGKERHDADHAVLACRALGTLARAFAAWSTANVDDLVRAELLAGVETVLGTMPAELHSAAVAGVGQWSEASRRMMKKKVGKR